MFRFEFVEYLNFLLLIPLIIILFTLYKLKVKKNYAKLGDVELIKKLTPDISYFKINTKFLILLFSLAFLIIGLANPQIGSKMEEIKREGVEVMIAIDISNSMLSDDIKPSRLEMAKSSVLKLIDKLKQDKIGIVLFAGDAFLQLPLTTDYSAAKLMVSTISTSLIDMQGTAIGAAINLSKKSFSENQSINKVLILISDGENHEDDALGAAKSLEESGIMLHTIGMGTVNGGPIPIIRNGRSEYLKDQNGETVLTKLDANMLQQIASEGNGQFVRAGNRALDLENLIQDIQKLEKAEFETKIFTDYDDKFQLFFLLAFIFLILEFLISEKKNKLLNMNKIIGVEK